MYIHTALPATPTQTTAETVTVAATTRTQREGGRGYAKGGASPDRAGGEGKEEADMGGGKRDPYADNLFEPFSPVNSPDHLFDLLDEDGKRVSLHSVHVELALCIALYFGCHRL